MDHQKLKTLLGPLGSLDLSGPTMRKIEERIPGGWNELTLLTRICKEAESATLVRGTYRQGAHHTVKVGLSQKFFVQGYRFRKWSILQIGIPNPRLWKQSIADQNLTIVDGRLILAILNTQENNAEVLLAEQSSGMSVKPAIATLTKTHSHWEINGAPDKKHSLLEILCLTVKRGRAPDDLLWQATFPIRASDESRLFEEYAGRSIQPSDASGGDALN